MKKKKKTDQLILQKDIARQIVKSLLGDNKNVSIKSEFEKVRLLRERDGKKHLDWAREAVKDNNFLKARIEYMKCVEAYKQFGDKVMWDEAQNEYDEFVKNDPIFKTLVSYLIQPIKSTPGVTQAEIGKKYPSIDWMDLQGYDRPIAKEDIYYALYFADKFGLIRRNKKGRTYELYSNEA